MNVVSQLRNGFAGLIAKSAECGCLGPETVQDCDVNRNCAHGMLDFTYRLGFS